MDLLLQVGENQALVVYVQYIRGASGVEHQAAALGQGLQAQVDLGVVPQGFKVAHALHGVFDGLLVENPAVFQSHFQAEPLQHHCPEHLQLDLAHNLDVNLTPFPHKVQLWVFLLKQPELWKHRRRVRALGQGHPVGHDGLQGIAGPLGLRPQTLTGKGLPQSRHRQQGPGGGFLQSREFFRAVAAKLQDLLLPLLPFLVVITQHFPDFQPAAGDFQPGQPVSLGVPGDFVHPGGEVAAVGKLRGVGVDDVQKLPDALLTKGRTEEAGKELPPGNEAPEIGVGDNPGFQVIFQQGLVAEGGALGNSLFFHAEVHAAGRELGLELRENGLPVGAGQVHFVDEEKHRHLVPLQQPPEGQGVGLDAVGAADEQHRAVKDGHGPLGLGGKVHMARGVHQGHVSGFRLQKGLLGENGNAPGPFQGVGVQKGVSVVHPSQGPPGAGGIEQGLAEGGLPRIHMGQKTQT